MYRKRLQFRKLNQENLEELVEISKTTYYDTYAKQNTDDNIQHYLEESFSIIKLNEELLEKNSEFYFIYFENEVLGYIKINVKNAQHHFKESSGMEIERIYVLKEYQAKGIGKEMLNFIINIAKQRLLRYVWLGVWEENKKAINFYMYNGFKIDGSFLFHMGNDIQTDYIMKLKF